MKRDSILDHFLRGRIYQYIEVYPGATFTQIKMDLNISNGTLVYHLKVLEREKYIKSETKGWYKYFYLWGRKPLDNGFYRPSNIGDEILRIIEEHTSKNKKIKQTDIAHELNVSKERIHYYIRKFRDENILEKGRPLRFKEKRP